MENYDIDMLKQFFESIYFSQPLSKKVLEFIITVYNHCSEQRDRDDDLVAKISTEILCEAFTIQEVMIGDKFYNYYCS